MTKAKKKTDGEKKNYLFLKEQNASRIAFEEIDKMSRGRLMKKKINIKRSFKPCHEVCTLILL